VLNGILALIKGKRKEKILTQPKEVGWSTKTFTVVLLKLLKNEDSTCCSSFRSSCTCNFGQREWQPWKPHTFGKTGTERKGLDIVDFRSFGKLFNLLVQLV